MLMAALAALVLARCHISPTFRENATVHATALRAALLADYDFHVPPPSRTVRNVSMGDGGVVYSATGTAVVVRRKEAKRMDLVLARGANLRVGEAELDAARRALAKGTRTLLLSLEPLAELLAAARAAAAEAEAAVARGRA